MKIYVTGATGVLGKRIVKELSGLGHNVVGMARSAKGEETVRSLGGAPSHAALFDKAALLKDIEGSDVVIHAATSIPVKTRLSQEDFALNDRIRREGTQIVTDCAVEAGARKIIFQDVVWVARPEDGSFYDENSPVVPSPAVQSGIDGEKIVLETGEKHGIVATVLRCGFFYGSDTAHTRQMGAGLKRRAFPVIGDGEGLWSLIHVDDAASAFVTAALEDLPGIWHVVDDMPVKTGEFLNHFAGRIGAPPPYRFPVWLARFLAGSYSVGFFTSSNNTSSRKLKGASSWSPKYPTYREGIPEVVQDWKAEGFLL
ncbi:MAG: NAD-dependent epimerase/dehydratase family protein [Candidatus Dadabacteria bacterium]|nr:NAD-dependent epimerase/dehydratase family protein [Candidatus Dadabacteria bacterium]